jgi:glycosyltransferase involved in cell wall biosynthesis
LKKQVIIVELFEFGGSNSHLKTLIRYFGASNVVLLLKEEKQLVYLENIDGADGVTVIIDRDLYPYAHLNYRLTTNLKELFYILRSIFSVQLLLFRYGLAGLSISSVDPEKYLYLLWMPFLRVTYILHSTPGAVYTWFTSITCNFTLGPRKRVITVSRANRDLICENWGISDRKKKYVHIVYNCVLENGFKKGDGAQTAARTVLTMGHLVAYKNPVFWLEVAKIVAGRYRDVKFIWLGGGPLWDELNTNSENYDNISFRGVVSDPVRFLRLSTIYYQPSLSETQGIAVVEAMAQSLPCIVSDTGGLPETVEHGYSGLVVPPTNIHDHVAAICSLLDDSAMTAAYGRHGLQRASDFFSFKNFKKKMDALYLGS